VKLKPLRTRLEDARRRTGVPWDVLEKDYVLSWVLCGISRVPALADSLVFKGGTALKKCYFGEYRFSEDLDFSTIGDAPSGDAMEQAVANACLKAAKLVDQYAPVSFECSRYTERDPHPGGQEAFVITAQLPWHRKPQTKVMIEITTDEPVLRPPVTKRLLHEYEEPLEADVAVYALEEIVAEKLRAILQHAAKLMERGWSRSRARDYYDLWQVLKEYESDLDLAAIPGLLTEKCAVRNVRFESSDDFFTDEIIRYVEKTWEEWLGPLVPDLPEFSTVMDWLRPSISQIVG
jgi:predicted nucleotidyltransferase component of viral defense system